jgi:hypothetical protein
MLGTPNLLFASSPVYVALCIRQSSVHTKSPLLQLKKDGIFLQYRNNTVFLATAAKSPRGARVISTLTGFGHSPKSDFCCLAPHILHLSFFFSNAQGDHQHTGTPAYGIYKTLVLMLTADIIHPLLSAPRV